MTTSQETQTLARQMRQTRDHLASLLVQSYLRHATLMQTETRLSRNNQV